MPRYEVLDRVDLDPDDDDYDERIAFLTAQAKKIGGFLHIEVRRGEQE